MRRVFSRFAIGVVLAVGAGACSSSGASSAADSSAADVESTGEATDDMSPVAVNLEAAVGEAISRQSEENVVVLDVRTDEEWNEAHATDAAHWGLAEHLENGELPALDKDTEIYIYCQSGVRSTEAIEIMQDAGFTNLTNIRGLENWVAVGGETVTGIDGDSQ